MTESQHDDVRRMLQKVLANVFDKVVVWLERIQADAPTPAPGSSLFKDDEVTDPYRVSQAVNMALVSAVDHLETFRVVVGDAQVMPARAAFTLLRAVLENAAIAVWLLAPEERTERVLRRLRLQWADVRDEYRALQLAGGSPQVPQDDRKTELQQIARASGLSEQQISKVTDPPKWSCIVQSAGEEARELTGERARLWWTLSSGIAHARAWAALSPILDNVVPPRVDGDLVHVKLRASDKAVMATANIAALMVAEGWRLFDERHQAQAV